MAPETIQPGETTRPFDLMGLAEDLRHNGFSVGPDQCVAAQRVLVTLAADRGIGPTSDILTLLSPIFCHTRDEQDRFGQFLDRWLSPGLAQPSIPASQSSAVLPEPAAELPWAWIAIALALVAVFIGIWLSTNHGAATPDGPQSKTASAPAGSASQPAGTSLVTSLPKYGESIAAVVLFLIGLGLLWWALARLVMRRGFLPGSPRLTSLPVSGLTDHLFSGPSFRRAIQNLARHRAEPSTDIDPALTVCATVDHYGAYTPVFGLRKTRPEYLALIERASPRDQQAHLADDLMERARATGLKVERFFFQGEPSWLEQQSGEGAKLSLAELNIRYPEHSLIVMASEEAFLDPLTGEPAPWCLQGSGWRNRAAMLSAIQKAATDWELRGVGFRVLPSGETGLAELAAALDRGNKERPVQDTGPPYPPLLASRSRRWIDRLEPDPATLAKLCVQLRRYLGPEAYDLLAACAVYPEMRWEITLYLARTLFPNQNPESRLAPLLRLPWFRFGTMPNWLRLRLIAELPHAKAEQIRDSLQRLFYAKLFGPASGVTLEVVQQPLTRLQRAALQAVLRTGLFGTVLAQRSLPGETQDRVIVSFLIGRKLKPEELRYPGGLLGFLRRSLRAPLPRPVVPASRLARIAGLAARIIVSIGGAIGSFYYLNMGYDHLSSRLVGPIFGVVVLLWCLPIKALFTLRSALFLFLSTAIWIVVMKVIFVDNDGALYMRLGVLLGSVLLSLAHAWVLEPSWGRVRLAIPLTYAAFELGVPVMEALENHHEDTAENLLNYCCFWQFAYLLCMFGPRIKFLSRLDDWLVSTVTRRPRRTGPEASPLAS